MSQQCSGVWLYVGTRYGVLRQEGHTASSWPVGYTVGIDMVGARDEVGEGRRGVLLHFVAPRQEAVLFAQSICGFMFTTQSHFFSPLKCAPSLSPSSFSPGLSPRGGRQHSTFIMPVSVDDPFLLASFSSTTHHHHQRQAVTCTPEPKQLRPETENEGNDTSNLLIVAIQGEGIQLFNVSP